MNAKRLKIVLLAVPVAMAFASGLWLSLRFAGEAEDVVPQIGGVVLPEARPLQPFELIDGNGGRFVPSDFRGHWSFVYFGYTYCPDVCPLTLIELASLKKRLAADCANLSDQYYLVSVDPARDTPARLGEYVAYFDPSFHGLTGAVREIDMFANQVGAFYLIPQGQDPSSYLVSHSSTIALIDPDGNFHAVLTTPHTAAGMAADFAKIVARYRALDAGRTINALASCSAEGNRSPA